MAYPTTADLVNASSSPELRALNSSQQDALRASSIAAIEEYTGQRFEPYTATKTIDGSGAGELYLPARLETLTSISVKGVALALSDVVLSDDKDRVAWKGLIGTNYYERTLLELDERPRTFPYEAGAVAINGTWGWTTTPQRVITAIRYDMEDQAAHDANAMSSTIDAFRKMGLRDVSQGNLRATLAASPPTVSTRAVSLLDSYLWAGQIGRVV